MRNKDRWKVKNFLACLVVCVSAYKIISAAVAITPMLNMCVFVCEYRCTAIANSTHIQKQQTTKQASE